MKNEIFKFVAAAAIGALLVIILWPKPKPEIREIPIPFDTTPIYRHIDSALAKLPRMIKYKTPEGRTDSFYADTTTPIGKFPREVYDTVDSLPIWIDGKKNWHAFRLGFLFKGLAEDYYLASLPKGSIFQSRSVSDGRPGRFDFEIYQRFDLSERFKPRSTQIGAHFFYKIMGIGPNVTFPFDSTGIKTGIEIILRPRF